MKKLILALLLLTIGSGIAQTDKEKVLATVSKSAIEGHIYFLADDVLKGRETGTPENKIAAAYLANSLRGYGVAPNPQTGNYYQPVPLKKISPPTRFALTIDGKEFKNKVVIEAGKLEFKGDAVYLGYGLEADYKGADVSEKVIIIKGGSATSKDTRDAFDLREEKAALAKKAGALGIIELVKAKSNIWNFIDHNFNSTRLEVVQAGLIKDSKKTFTYMWLQDESGDYIDQIAEKMKVPINVTVSGEAVEMIESQNVIGVVPGTDPVLKNEYIIYSAHYDHVGIGAPDETGDTIYNGARDNAVGTTTVLSMAQNLAKYPTKRSALFILFTGEEKGLLGSEYYVEHPVLPLKQMVFCFNSDNGGYNDTSLATIIGLPRTSAAQNIKDGVAAFGLTAIDDPAPEQGLFDRSDNVHFAAKGIPAPTFSLGFTAFNGDVTKYYHRPGDHADNMDYNYLEKFFKAYVMTGRMIGNDITTPFWTAGDKYEAIGKKLYNK